MHWYFRDISDDPSEKELTQLDQFNNDEVALAEALVRESIQNSTDAWAEAGSTVRVRFAIVRPDSDEHQRTILRVINDLADHLRACDFAVPGALDQLRLLVIEDFGTTGLTGSVTEKDDKQFSGFWRRFGRSNKKEGAKGGRWGLGKLVFPSASAVRTVIGLTQRVDDTHQWVMGQAVLRNHTIRDTEHDSVGFWCRDDGAKRGAPSDDQKLYRSLCEAARLSRGAQPGLSLIVPFVLSEITKELLLEAAVRNYYFPILTERLIVDVEDIELNASTFDTIAASLPEAVSTSVLNFVRQMQSNREGTPHIILPSEWQNREKRISGELIGATAATDLRNRFKNNELIFVRAPLSFKDKNGFEYRTHIDLFFRKAQLGEKGQTLVVRGAITVPTEGRRSNFMDCHAALIAADEPVSRLLGDAENPAHTQWNERAEKLRLGWQRGAMVLRRVRAALGELHEVITEKQERDDPFAFLDFFSVPKADRGQSAPQQSAGRPHNLPPASPKPFRIQKRKGGFAILPESTESSFQFPLTIRVRCAYDVLSGNPFKRFSELDFDLFKAHHGTSPNGALSILKKNADCWPTQPNEIDVRVHDQEFSVQVLGFDPNRDLVVEAQS
jgi:hypothetical protein